MDLTFHGAFAAQVRIVVTKLKVGFVREFSPVSDDKFGGPQTDRLEVHTYFSPCQIVPNLRTKPFTGPLPASFKMPFRV